MKIAIEARALSASRGVRSYVQHLVTALLARYADDAFVVAYDRAAWRGTFAPAQEIVVPLRHELLVRPWLAAAARQLLAAAPDVLHFTKAAVPRGVARPVVVTIYDVIPLLFPEGQSFFRRWYWRAELARAAARAQHIITISETSRQDVVRVLGVSSQKITVTPLAVDTNHFRHRRDPELLRRTYRIAYPYIISVGTLEPRKNLELLVRAFAQCASLLPHHLLLVGKKGLATASINAEIRKHHLSERVHWLPSVPTDDLPALLSRADLFVFPSIYEGWGLPPLEAMACGVPTIVSDGGALPEAVGDAAHLVPFTATSLLDRRHDTDFEKTLAHTMAELLTSPAALQQLREQGLRQVQLRTWAGVAEATHRVYAAVAQIGL